MKKALLAAAILAALSNQAFAASVSVYGRADIGLQWTHADNGYDGMADCLGLRDVDSQSEQLCQN